MNELQNRPIESLFEELENITLPTTEVNELVTDLKNIVMDQLTWKSVEKPPKHGTGYVLARHKLDRPFIASYRRDIGGWLDVGNSLRDPTHWMPIPKLD